MLCRFMKFSWAKEIEKTLNKEVCLDTSIVASMITQLSEKELDRIAWINKPDYTLLMKDAETICTDMLSEGWNTLYREQESD